MPRHSFQVWSCVLAVCLLLFVSGCRRRPPEQPPAPPPPPAATPPPAVQQKPPPPPPPPAQPPPVQRELTEEERFARMTLAELNDSRPLEDVYFEYDKSDLSDPARASLQKNAEWLKRWSSTRITVEGHADSRGTNEYNLALGERRANAARDYLVTLGVPAARISTVSKGEEEPACREDAESCWSQNRRGHFIITAK
jgi:peptidoglycan-associated lipoprotein